MHYVITSSNYDEFMMLKQRLEAAFSTDDISEICGEQHHPWYAWLTHGVANIIRAEALYILSLITITFIISVVFNWAFAIAFAFFCVMTLFSIWVSGLVGWHVFHLYGICQRLTRGVEHPLVLLVDVDQSRSEEVKSLVSNQKSCELSLIKE